MYDWCLSLRCEKTLLVGQAQATLCILFTAHAHLRFRSAYDEGYTPPKHTMGALFAARALRHGV